jgi:hypothetical protein
VSETTGRGTQVSSQKTNTQDNTDTLNGLYEVLIGLSKDGKALYGHSNQAKRDNYTLSRVLKRVRQKREGKAEKEG